MATRGATLRRSVELEVPAHVAYERMARTEEYPQFRTGVREITAIAEGAHRWELADTCVLTEVDERRPDELLRWHSVAGPTCTETVVVQPLSPRRSRLTVETSGPPALLNQLVADLAEFKRCIERDHPPVGHYINERTSGSFRHRSNWRDGLLRGRTTTGRAGTGDGDR